MCEFVSWKIKNDEPFWLTDAEVFSEEGREKLKGCAHNDFLGHGAITAFWGVDGVQCEAQDFWNLEKLPEKIRVTVETIEAFDRHYGQMWKAGYFQNEDLLYIVTYAPEAWKEKAWARLLEQKPTNEDLLYIVTYAPEAWKEKARKLLNG